MHVAFADGETRMRVPVLCCAVPWAVCARWRLTDQITGTLRKPPGGLVRSERRHRTQNAHIAPPPRPRLHSLSITRSCEGACAPNVAQRSTRESPAQQVYTGRGSLHRSPPKRVTVVASAL